MLDASTLSRSSSLSSVQRVLAASTDLKSQPKREKSTKIRIVGINFSRMTIDDQRLVKYKPARLLQKIINLVIFDHRAPICAGCCCFELLPGVGYVLQ